MGTDPNLRLLKENLQELLPSEVPIFLPCRSMLSSASGDGGGDDHRSRSRESTYDGSKRSSHSGVPGGLGSFANSGGLRGASKSVGDGAGPTIVAEGAPEGVGESTGPPNVAGGDRERVAPGR